MEEITEVGPTDPLWRAAFDRVLVASAPPWLGPPDFDILTGIMASGVGSTFVLTLDGEPFGITSGEWYEAGRVLLASYIAILPDSRARGLGVRLQQHSFAVWTERHRPCAILAEVELPGVNPTTREYGDAVARVRFHSRHGGRALDLPYFQPAFDGTRRLHHTMLVMFRMDPVFRGPAPETFVGEPLLAFLEEYLRKAEGQLRTDPATTALLEAARDPQGVRLVDMDEEGLRHLASR